MKKAIGLTKYFGLMFRSSSTEPIYWEFEKEVSIPMHTLFCPKVLITWIDKFGERIERREVKPFSWNVKPKKPFTKIVEVPIP